jgi:hypothetical protein
MTRRLPPAALQRLSGGSPAALWRLSERLSNGSLRYIAKYPEALVFCATDSPKFMLEMKAKVRQESR